jgi:hypothetical protein
MLLCNHKAASSPGHHTHHHHGRPLTTLCACRRGNRRRPPIWDEQQLPRLTPHVRLPREFQSGHRPPKLGNDVAKIAPSPSRQPGLSPPYWISSSTIHRQRGIEMKLEFLML